LIVGDYLCWYQLERKSLEERTKIDDKKDNDGCKIYIIDLNELLSKKEIEISKINYIDLRDLNCLREKNLNDIKLSVAPISTHLSLRSKNKS